MSWDREQRRARANRQNRRNGKGKSKICFGFKKEVKLGRKPTNLLFIPGNYTSYLGNERPYWAWLKHKHFREEGGQTKIASFVCTRCAEPNWGGECLACEVSTMIKNREERDPSVSSSEVIHWSVIVLDWFYRSENKYGDIIYARPDTPKETKDLENDPNVEKVFGCRLYLPLGPSHAAQFDDLVVKNVARMCRGCEEELGPESAYDGGLEPALFKCRHCEYTIEDLAVSDLTGDEIADIEYGVADMRCPSCGAVDWVNVEYGCLQCTTPTNTSLFDTVVPLCKYVSKTDKGKTSSNLMLPPGKGIKFATDFTLPNGEPLMRYIETGDPDNPVVRDINPMLEHLYYPIDFKGELFATQFNPQYQIERTGGRLGKAFTPRKKD
ncbi:MAG: hypothetical protein CL678_11710 [Bdellovibrionaceae bacterium]|nr:hypothetical protein [Pseudobdellovibrionaceae bacterium]|tara:strand:- start:2563 stop:3708 length:1146 start_codon:yes stop_codon:yes gene_type:complete